MPPLGVVISPFCPAMLTKYQRRGIFFFLTICQCVQKAAGRLRVPAAAQSFGVCLYLCQYKNTTEHHSLWLRHFYVVSTCACVCLAVSIEGVGGSDGESSSSHYQPFAFHPSGKGYLRNRAAIKAAPQKPLRTIFCFTPKHAHSFHLCVVLKWTLRDIVAPRSKTRMIYLPEEGTNLFQICFHRPHSWATSQQRVGRGSRAADWSRYCSVSLFFWARVWICAWGRSRQISEGDRKAGRPTGLKPLLLQLPLDFSPATV